MRSFHSPDWFHSRTVQGAVTPCMSSSGLRLADLGQEPRGEPMVGWANKRLGSFFLKLGSECAQVSCHPWVPVACQGNNQPKSTESPLGMNNTFLGCISNLSL